MLVLRNGNTYRKISRFRFWYLKNEFELWVLGSVMALFGILYLSVKIALMLLGE